MKNRKILSTLLLAISLVGCNNNTISLVQSSSPSLETSSSSSITSSSNISNSMASSSSSSTSSSSMTTISSTSTISSITSSIEDAITIEDFEIIIQNTFALQEVSVHKWYIPAVVYNNFYVEDGLMYENIDETEEIYTYLEDYKNYKMSRMNKDDNWTKSEIMDDVEYNLGYYLSNMLNFEVKNDFKEYSYEAFDNYIGGSGVTFYNNDDVKIGCIINDTGEYLAGIHVYDKNENIIYQYTITKGKQVYEIPKLYVDLVCNLGDK